MKKSAIYALVVIAIAAATILSMTSDASTYVNFKQAYDLAKSGSEKKIHVVGTLKKDPKTHEIVGMSYNPVQDPNLFTFILVDHNNEEREVTYFSPKPQDFERSEQVVVIGSFKNEHFVADKILMKCPSKYQDNEFRDASTGEKPV